MDGLVGVVVWIVVGVVLRRAKRLPEAAPQVLSAFVVHVSLPALVLERVPGLSMPPGTAALAVVPWVVLGASAALVLALARLLRWDRPTTGAMLLVVPLGNTSFLGLPMVRALLGEASVPYALLYDQLGTFLGLAVYGSFVLAAYAGTERPTVRGVARRVATFPPFLALLLALVLRGVELPPTVRAVLAAGAATLVPVIMVAVGLMLDVRVGRQGAAALAAGLAVKLVAAPAVAWTVCAALGVERDVLRVAVLEAAMPPMITAGALAASHGLAPRLAASMVGVGMVVALAWLPLLARWL